MPDSHTTSNFTDTTFKLKEVDSTKGNGFLMGPLTSPRSFTNNNNNTNCNTYRPSRPSQLLPSSTSLYSFKQQSSNTKQSDTQKRSNNKPQSQLVSPTEHKTSLNSLNTNHETDYSGKTLCPQCWKYFVLFMCCMWLNVVIVIKMSCRFLHSRYPFFYVFLTL